MAMTLQAIFDKVVTHLRTQKEQAMEGGDCLYRGPNGLMCAVGCLIKDEVYDKDIEDHPVSSECVIEVLILSGVLRGEGSVYTGEPAALDLLSELQAIHDTDLAFGMEVAEDSFEKIAEKFDLNLLSS